MEVVGEGLAVVVATAAAGLLPFRSDDSGTADIPHLPSAQYAAAVEASEKSAVAALVAPSGTAVEELCYPLRSTMKQKPLNSCA